jgi:hypothetical protein
MLNEVDFGLEIEELLECDIMTENMKFWLKELYLTEANDHNETAKFEHLCALGSDTDEASMLHEMNAKEHWEFASILEEMANEIDV